MKYTCDCEIEYFLNAKKILSNNIQMVKLEDYTAVELKKMIKSFNGIVKFGAYSKLKKSGLINMMKTHPKIKIQEGSNAVKISVVAEQETPLVVKEKKETKKSRLKKLKQQADQIEITEEEEEEPIKKKEKEVKADKMDMPKTKIKLPKELTKEEKERNENYEEEDENLKLYEEGKKIMTLKTYDRLVKRIDDTKLYLKAYDDLTKRLEKLKPEPVEKANTPVDKKEIKQFDIQKNILDFEEENKSWKQFLKDFKQGKNKFGGKIKLEDYEKNKIKLKKLLEKTEMLGRKLANQDIRNESDFYKGLVKTFISEYNKITRLYNKAKTRFNNLSYLLDYGGVDPEKKKEEPKPLTEEPAEKKEDNKEELLNKEITKLRDETLIVLTNKDENFLKKPSEITDPKLLKKNKSEYKKLFETYKKSYGVLLDKYDFSKDRYRKKASDDFNNILRKARQDKNKKEKESAPDDAEPAKDKLLNRLVATARSHAKNGITIAGLNDFYSKVTEYIKTNPPKLQEQLAGVLYNFLNKNIQMNKKKLPNNMNNALKELGYKEIKK